MYKSNLHTILHGALESTRWTRSTKDEDNYRQVLCASLYEHISPNNVEIPSTRSAHGDIKIFGRRIEVKYANSEKIESLDKVLEDFDLLLEKKIEFSIVVVRLDVIHTDDYLHNCIRLPMLKATGAAQNFAAHTFAGGNYFGPGIFLSAVYPHKPKPLTLRVGKGKNSTAYLSFENSPAIERSSILKIQDNYIHCDVVGSREDGFIAFLYKRMDDYDFEENPNSQCNIQIPYTPNPITIATSHTVNVRSCSKKYISAQDNPLHTRSFVENKIPVYTI